METKRKHKFGLQKKLVLFTVSVAIVTYSTSAIFIQFIYPYFSEMITEQAFTLLTLLLGIFWSGVLAYFAARLIVKPLQRIEEVVIDAGEGDISKDIGVSKSNDEIESLSIAFNQMLGNLRMIVTQIEENFQETNANVVAISEKSVHTAEQAQQTAQIIEDITAGADSSAKAIQTTAESVEEINRIAIEVQEKAQESEKITKNLLSDLVESHQTVQSLVSSIETLAEENKVSLSAVNRLEENANQVEEIIHLVGNIAKQTNLLALNASIEAARAGEHGKGFAVVAEEVRKLADQSAVAVRGISELIESIQSDVKNVVSHFNIQAQSTNEGVKKGMETNEVIAQMTTTIYQSADAVMKISQLVDEQLKSVKETSAQAQEVAAIAEETSAGASEVASTSNRQAEEMEEIDQLTEKLIGQAQKLKATISRFQL
ncbi:methyl-accepting chemotaxis protein [Pseudogracilibacillus auburnensis]|uniref:methyl-accepting chemotaxis protein n=1 Tax=Pseudogracilibacillus auburnensis TaxID=1494959 RepID=UPI001A97BB6E|nr:methyl-accepting chemotaxis protein [Pseudogracilibacillus auburnensis]MBO1004799.1 methyl-accepting chemotaxis protein [Pseudogracilibacillus auburnensis]